MTMQKSDEELIERLRAPDYWVSGPDEEMDSAPVEAADRLEALCTVRDDKELIGRARGHAMGLKEYSRYDSRRWSDLTCADAVSYGEFIDELADRLAALSAEREAMEATVYKVLRNWRLSTMVQADEPSEGYPLVDAVSTDGATIATGEAELGEIAAAIASKFNRTSDARVLADSKRKGGPSEPNDQKAQPTKKGG